MFNRKGEGKKDGPVSYATTDSAIAHVSGANLAIISVPGEFASREARKALDKDLNVMIFSDNVSIEDEIALKQYAHEKGLLVMGPVAVRPISRAKPSVLPTCFAGCIGIVGASGTGSQEIAVRIHDFGGGVTQIIGVGGRDLHERVGGIMMIDGIRLLEQDPATEIIVLVSKPAPSVEAKVLGEIRNCTKPVVVCFLGGDKATIEGAGGIYGKTTKETALQAVLLAGKPEAEINKRVLNLPLIARVRSKLKPEQKYIRALLCGGTLCEEMMLLAKETLPEVYSNIAKDPAHRMRDIHVSEGHCFIDFGDDDFTRGRPHR